MDKQTIDSLFDYKDGALFWKSKPCKNMKAGSIAGTKDRDGYLTIRYKGKHYKAHHLVYAMHTGIYPSYIDHIDRDRSNNKIENLREVSHKENMQNVGMYKNNKSGFKYIHWYKQTNRWSVMVRRVHIGYFLTIDEAKAALENYQKEQKQ